MNAYTHKQFIKALDKANDYAGRGDGYNFIIYCRGCKKSFLSQMPYDLRYCEHHINGRYGESYFEIPKLSETTASLKFQEKRQRKNWQRKPY